MPAGVVVVKGASGIVRTTTGVVSVGLVALLAFGLGSGAIDTQAAAAPNAQTLSIYLDAPFIQGSYVAEAAGAGTAWASFNDPLASGDCGYGQPAGFTVGGVCRVDPVADYGGATANADVDTPTVGGSGSNYPTTVFGDDPIVISMAADSRYLGLWWSAGSESNTITFYRDDALLLTMTTEDIIAQLGEAPADAEDWTARNTDAAENTITSIGQGGSSSAYRTMWYFGNPRSYESTTPTSIATQSAGEPFVYLHMFVGGSLTFDRVELSGGGFEFDNLVVSTLAQTPDPRLVLVSTIAATHTVEFDANAPDAQGSMAAQSASSTTPLSINGFSRPGFTFAGWNTEADGSGTPYVDGADFDFDTDATLYAQWSSISAGGGGDTLAATGQDAGSLIALAGLLLALGGALAAVSSRAARRQPVG